MEKVIDPQRAVDYILHNAKAYAFAKAHRIYVEEYRKSLKAMLMKRSMESAVNAQEREAYSHDEYREHLQAICEAVMEEEKYRWELIAAQARIEVWRSQEASNRTMDRVTI